MSCAAATASWLLIVSFWKSMCPSPTCPWCEAHYTSAATRRGAQRPVPSRPPPHVRGLRRLVDDEVAPVEAVHFIERLAHLLLHPLEAALHSQQLVFHVQDALDAGQVQAELAGEPLNQAQPVDVRVGVEPRVAGG